MTEPRWYAVLTKPQAEELADRELRAAAFWTFFPCERVTRRIKRGHKVVRETRNVPYFPRYIFVALRGNQTFHAVNKIRGVSTVVYGGPREEPLPVPNGVIDELMERVDDEAGAGSIITRRDLTAKARFGGKPGQTVRFGENSPLHGLIAEISSLKGLANRNEICVWLEALGSRREVTVAVEAVAEIVV